MITQYKFKEGQYIKQVTKKNQIYLHHTAGGSDPYAVYKWWEMNKERIATHFVIGADGNILQGYDLKYWAFHLGAKESTFNSQGVRWRSLDKQSIGIELCNWGQLTKRDGICYNYVNKVVDADEVTILDEPFKGFSYYHAYTDAQIESLRKLIIHIKDQTGIDTKVNFSQLWDISKEALKGTPGIYTHNSVRRDKNDVYPCPKLIRMLQQL
jgi:N-acetyl-anhydromuramyl-L-alanine amidase AmpD